MAERTEVFTIGRKGTLALFGWVLVASVNLVIDVVRWVV